MAIVLARHGSGSRTAGDPPALVMGFGSPPQLDLYVNTPYYHDGVYVRPGFKKLATAQRGDK